MEKVKIRVLYPRRVRRESAEAALKGLGYFKRLGALCDAAELSKESIKQVRYGNFISRVLNVSGEVGLHAFSSFKHDVFESLMAKDTYGMGLATAHFRIIGENKKYDTGGIGCSMFQRGSLLSLARFGGLEPELRLKAIEIAAKHEAGHIFIERPHCFTVNCVMMENEHFPDFIEDFVRNGRDFCRKCENEIALNLFRLETLVF